MSGVSFLDGVEVAWVPLGSVAQIGTGSSNRQDENEEGVYPFYVRSKNVLKSNSFEFDEEAIIIPGEGGIGDIFHYVEGKYALHQRAYRIHIVLGHVNTKFMYHFMRSSFKKFIISKSVGATAVSIRKPMIEGFSVPIPCPNDPQRSLQIQAEIVRILDTFTELTTELITELTTELTARKKQYNYYRERLLSFEEGEVEWKTLGDIGDVRMCKRILKKDTQPDGGVPFYKIGTFGKRADAFIPSHVYEDLKSRYPFPRKGDVLISASGTIGRAVVYNGEPAYFQDSNIVWLENNEDIVTNRYLWHFYKIARWFVSEGGTIDRLYNDNIKKTRIPVPYPNEPEKSFAAQNRVVAILDKFDALTNSITEGLPREIELRQKQYAHYRDLLLTFPKPAEVEA